MKKRLIALLIAALLVLSLSVGALAAEEPETLKVGLMVHTTGWFATVDAANFNEFNAMVSYINQNGGWTVGDKTYMLEAVCVDGQSDYTALRTAAMSLVDAGVDYVVETNDFWVSSCADVFEEEGILHASAYCVGPSTNYLVPENPLAFTGTNGTFGDLQCCYEALKQYYPDVKKIVYANDDNGSTDEIFAFLQEMAPDYDFEVVDQVIYPGDSTDYSAIAQQIVDSGADAFIGNGSPDVYGAILKAIRSLDSDMVMACAQGKPVALVMEYAGEDASYNGFTIGASSRASDSDKNTELFNSLVEVVREEYGDESAAAFDGAAANTLYTILQMMQRAGSIEPEDVAAAWEEGGEIDSLYGPAFISGEEIYGMPNHAVSHPRPISVMNPEGEDGWEFAGWILAGVTQGE